MGKVIGIGNGIGIRKGSKLKHLTFEVDEGETVVGQINEPSATSFEITEGSDDFTIDDSGNIAFISAPDYETQNLYALRVKSNKGERYYITVSINDVVSTFAYVYDTAYLYETAY